MILLLLLLLLYVVLFQTWCIVIEPLIGALVITEPKGQITSCITPDFGDTTKNEKRLCLVENATFNHALDPLLEKDSMQCRSNKVKNTQIIIIIPPLKRTQKNHQQQQQQYKPSSHQHANKCTPLKYFDTKLKAKEYMLLNFLLEKHPEHIKRK